MTIVGFRFGCVECTLLVPFLTTVMVLQDKASNSNLKIEALVFTRLVMASHAPAVFHPHIKVCYIQVDIPIYIVYATLLSVADLLALLVVLVYSPSFVDAGIEMLMKSLALSWQITVVLKGFEGDGISA